ncbi:MAG: hypothetical protein Q8L48_19095 [Archangium sp.]|nr:hypothetical protein [Archangium sp.]
MEALVFPSEEALQVAMRSGLVPADLQREPARVGTTKEGLFEVVPEGSLTAKARKALLAAGVESRPSSVELSPVSCWAEALSPRRVGEPAGAMPQVLFTVTGRRSLLELSGELLRLGCDRQELSMVKSPHAHALVRVVDPPWFVLSRALDHLDGLRAFVPTSPGQERLWTEVAWAHPLDTTLEAPDVGMVLMTREGPWWRISDSEWIDIDQLVVPVGLGAASQVEPKLDAPKVQVTLTLARAARPEAPTLFVLPAGQAAVEALVRSTPEAQLENILFVVSDDLVVLRARPGREANAGALPGEAYARVLDMPNLFAPAALTVEPPLRRDRLRTWLAPDPDLITWLEPTAGGFGRRSVLEAAFRPLAEWVDYVIDGAAETLQTWARSAAFDFEPFIALEDAQPQPSDAKEDDEVQRSRPRSRREPRPSAPREAAPTETAPRTSTPVVAIDLPRSLSEAEAVVAREETAFLELEAAADSVARRTAWVRLAEMYSRVQRPRDSGMAWAHALWEANADEALRMARRWADTSGVRLESLLAQAAPNIEQTRGAVAHLLAASLENNQSIAARVTDWVTFLDRFSEDLDVRSYWLGRVAVARLAGGDTLGLARARDRVLARVQGGLSLDRDVPRLLRVMGQATAAGAGTGRAMRVGAQLEALLKAFEETPRKRSAVESPPQLTRAYVGLEFAWGFARLANAERARQLRDAALAVLDRKDSVHAYLTRAYVARIDQALEGVAPYTPLAPEINGLLTGLEALDRYKVDRLRQFSQVLEPQERLEAISAFWRNNTREGRGEELGALRSLREPAELLKAIQTRMSVAADAQLGVEERVRLIDGLLDYLPQLPESQALPLLQRFLTIGDALAAKHRAVVLEDALKIAGHFGRAALVKQLVLQLGNAIKEVGGEGVGEIGGLLVSGVRSLRRVGLREEAGELLSRASTVLKGEDVPTLQARLGLASGFMYLGAFQQAQPIIDEALGRLGRESGLIIAERIKLTRATAQALSHASTELALPGLLRVAQQLPWITDSFNTNSHFCLSMVDFADALVLGHVGDDLTLNETTRRFLDEDEYLVRRRVHRDVGGDT